MIPSRIREQELLARLAERSQRPILAGVDEVGRGSIAGPVSVGIALCGLETSDDFPSELRDSKQLSPAKRESLVPACYEWALDIAVGHASAQVVDSEGIIGALRHAAREALNELSGRGWEIDAVLLDGKHDWWSEEVTLFDEGEPVLPQLPVHMEIGGDASCAIVAAASVAAKVERDRLMCQYDEEYPVYAWARNKGYGTRAHYDALKKHGVSPLHRLSWNLRTQEERR
ncbi:MAG: ribonuclease HII [Actinomycetaceae bacterium]|nr:ribonuclease HII [Actinomycetaceae bacterium]